MSRKRKRAVTIRDVANLAGVAVSTVSRALSEGPVSLETRSKVQRAAEDLHFIPSATARQLSNGQTRIIAIVIPQEAAFIFPDPFIAALVSQLTVYLSKLGYLPFLSLMDYGEESRFVSLLENSGAEGMVVTGFCYSKSFVRIIEDFSKPTVFVGHPADDYPYVDIDNQQGGRLAADALLKAGRRKTLMIAGPRNMQATQGRSQGFSEVFTRAGGEIMVSEGSFSLHHGYSSMKECLESEMGVDSVFAQSDQIATGAIQAMSEHGVKYPEDISIVGFDNLEVASNRALSLTTVDQPVADMAKRAVEMLTNRIETGNWIVRKEIFEVKLVTRRSV